jgi:long-chain acyl-CoA synthetase
MRIHPRERAGEMTSAEPTTLNELFALALEGYGSRPDVLTYRSEGRWVSISAETLAEWVRILTFGFYAHGIRPGDHVALLSENRLEWTLSDLALLALGAVDVPIHATQAPAQVAHILRDSGARMLLLSTGEQWRRIRDVLSQVESVETIVTFEAIGDAEARVLPFAQLFDAGRQWAAHEPDLYDRLRRAVRPSDLATLLYTSGTTGDPKGVMLTHGNITSNVTAAMRVLGYSSRDVVLSILPLSHSFERMAFYCYLYGGLSISYAESFDKIAENLRDVRPTVVVGVPRLFEKMRERILMASRELPALRRRLVHWGLRTGERYHRMRRATGIVSGSPRGARWSYEIAERFVLSRIRQQIGLDRARSLISGGAALAPDIAYFFLGLGLEILQGYGLTETSPVVTVNPPGANKIGTVGRPIPGVEVRIADDGEILVRGPNVMLGYYRRPEETAAAFTADGWLRTGDVGTLDADGYLVITDRKKDLIKTSGGKYVAPQALENRLVASPLIAQAVVVGDQRKFPVALIVPQFDALRRYAEERGISAPDAHHLCAHPAIHRLYEEEVERLMADFSPYERVKKIALLERELTIADGELTPTLKVRRRIVEEKYRDVIERLYAE